MVKKHWFDMQIDSAGYITQDGEQFGFCARSRGYDAPYSQREVKWAVVKFEGWDGRVFASGYLLDHLIETQFWCGPFIKVGRRKMFKVTPELLKQARARNAYSRRSEREREVQMRNYSLINWFETLAES